MKRLMIVVVGLLTLLVLAVPYGAEAQPVAEVKKLTASDAEDGDRFGFSVAVCGDTAVIGAYWEDEGGDNAGTAYVFYRDQGGADNWGQVKRITALAPHAGDLFGSSVACSGDTIVVGAYEEDVCDTNSGAAYVFYRDQGGADNWGQVKRITPSPCEAGAVFGQRVALSGDTTVVGAPGEDDTILTNAGAAYVFYRDQGGADNWGQAKRLPNPDPAAEEHFGFSVAMSGTTAVVGAFMDDAVHDDAGAAYVLYRDQGGTDNWGQVKKLTASDAENFDYFGQSAAISGDTAVVGARGEDGAGSDRGAAYVFERDQGGAGNWGEVTKLIASDAEDDDEFGQSAAISGETAVVGAYLEDEAGSDRGAAYVFVPPAVGGIAELPDLAGGRLETDGSSGGGFGAWGAIGVAAGIVVLSGAAWYARRRWVR